MVYEKKEIMLVEDSTIAQLGMIELCGVVKNQLSIAQLGMIELYGVVNNNQHQARLCTVDTRATHDSMIEDITKRLELKIAPFNFYVKIININPQNTHGVANGAAVKLCNWQGTTNFIATTLDIFYIILGQEFFRNCHTLIDFYLQWLFIIE